MAFKPHGIVVPIVTPVTQDGKFNEKAYRDLIEYLASSGIHGVFPFGTTGEFYAHDMGFYREVLAVTKDAVRGRMDIYAGANNITTRAADNDFGRRVLNRGAARWKSPRRWSRLAALMR